MRQLGERAQYIQVCQLGHVVARQDQCRQIWKLVGQRWLYAGDAIAREEESL
jgi:hypothetical protein